MPDYLIAAPPFAFIGDENARLRSRLPLSGKERAMFQRRRFKQIAAPNSNLVFVVDDDPGMLRAVGRLLRQIGYACLLFPSAAAFANHGGFDGVVCVLLDIDLSDGSGIEQKHRLKAAGNTVPVIYMTANDSPAVRMAAHQSGCLPISPSRSRRSR